MKISERDRKIWKAAITLAHNICIRDANIINDDDGPLCVVAALSDEAKRIGQWLEPSNEILLEMFAEAQVPEIIIIDNIKKRCILKTNGQNQI